jgi:hypothetical protein
MKAVFERQNPTRPRLSVWIYPRIGCIQWSCHIKTCHEAHVRSRAIPDTYKVISIICNNLLELRPYLDKNMLLKWRKTIAIVIHVISTNKSHFRNVIFKKIFFFQKPRLPKFHFRKNRSSPFKNIILLTKTYRIVVNKSITPTRNSWQRKQKRTHDTWQRNQKRTRNSWQFYLGEPDVA